MRPYVLLKVINRFNGSLCVSMHSSWSYWVFKGS